MKILKPGKVEMRKFVCAHCGCVFVADESDLRFTPTEAKIRCPCCWLEQKWMRGEPYEEPAQDDRERLAKLFNEGKDRTNFIDFLIEHGVTFREV